MKRVGLIPDCFGRLVNFFAAYLLITENPDRYLNSYRKLIQTSWIFPNVNQFPFLAKELSRFLDLKTDCSLALYRVLTKNGTTLKLFTSSIDDFEHISTKTYGNPSLGYLLNEQSIYDSKLHMFIGDLKSRTRGLIGFYARENSWDVYLNRSNEYLAAENHRNPSINESQHLIDTLLELEFGVIRLGRSSNPLFDLPRKNFFDYAAEFLGKSDKTDFYLWNEVDLGVATSSGGCQPGYFFGKPMLIWDLDEPFQILMNTLTGYPFQNIIVVPRYDEHKRNNIKILKDPLFLKSSIDVLLKREHWKNLQNFGLEKIKNFLIKDYNFNL